MYTGIRSALAMWNSSSSMAETATIMRAAV